MKRTYTERRNRSFGIRAGFEFGINFPSSREVTEEITDDRPQLTSQTQPKALQAPPGKTLGHLKCPYCGHRHETLDLVNDDGIIDNSDVDCRSCGRPMAIDCKMEYVFKVRRTS